MTDSTVVWQQALPAASGNFNTMHTFDGDGNADRTFEINFSGGYIKDEHVKAYMMPYGTADYEYLTLTFINESTVRLSAAVPVGWTVTIYRDTPKDVPLASFTDGALITAASLDRNAEQAIFGVAEMVDRFNATQESVDLSLDIANEAMDVAEQANTNSIQAIEIAKVSERAIRVPAGESVNDIPDAVNRAGKLLAFNASGDVFVASPVSGDATDVLLTLNGENGAGLVGSTSGTVQGSLDALAQADVDLDTRIDAHITALQSVYGSSLVGVASYADVRNYTGNASRLVVKGRSTSGDGGAGTFVLSASDVVSADDGGVVLVDSLGRRWKRDFQGAIQASWYGVVSGANVSSPLTSVLQKGGGQVYIGAGQFNVESQVTISHDAADFPVMGRPSKRFDLVGDSMTNTTFNTNGVNCLSYTGTAGSGGHGVHSGMTFRDFSIYGTGNTGVGLRAVGSAYLKIRDLDIKRTNIAMRLSGVLSSDIQRVNLQYNNHGIYIDSATNSTFNAMRMSGMFGSNSKWAIEGEVGTNIYIEESNFEGNGTLGDSASGAIYLRVVEPLSTINISGYFEANVGRADILIDNRTSSPCVVNLRGCVFNRGGMRGGDNLGKGCTYNIETRSTGGGRVILNLDGCMFFTQTGFGYVPSASTPYIQPAPYLTVNGENTCHFSENISRAVITGSYGGVLGLSVRSDGTVDNKPLYITATRVSTGVYMLDSSIPFAPTAAQYQVVATSKSSGLTVSYAQKVSPTSIRVVTVNAAGAVADNAFDLLITRS